MPSSAWLIERHIGNTLNYWSPGARGRGDADNWTSDIDFAVRFTREQDAIAVLYNVCAKQGRAAQHAWVDRALPTTAEPAKGA